MKDIEKIISPLLQSHFPSFYLEEGPRFIDFVKQYYIWLESAQGTLNASRSLFDYRDVDKTAPEFVQYFDHKYLGGVPLLTQSNTQFLVKHASEIYQSKGTERGIKLVIQGLFNESADVYFPGTDVFKASHGTWYKPQYLELNVTDRAKQYVGREILGNISGAKAFVESLVRRRFNGKYVEMAYLSNLRGNFETGECITTVTDQSLDGAPKVVGSLTTLTVVSGGAEFSVGDIFNITSSYGKQGKGRVTSISEQTGTVDFIYVNALTSGGWGYDLTNSQFIVSSKVLEVSNTQNANAFVNTFSQFETISQNLVSIAYTTARPNNANYTVGAIIENYDGTGVATANAIIISSTLTTNTTGTLIVSPQTGNVSSVDSVFAIKGTGTSASFNANSGVANTTEIVTTTTSHGFVNGDILIYKLLTGNTGVSGLSVGAAYYAVNAVGTTLQLSDTVGGSVINLTAGLDQTGHVLTKSLGSGVITTYIDRTATGNVIASNTTHLGINYISGNSFIITPNARIVGRTSNTTTTLANTGTGIGANVSIGSITDTETVYLSPDFLIGVNSNNVIFNTINLNGNNSGAGLQYGSPIVLSGGSSAYGGFGFTKFPGSNMDSRILDCLIFSSTTLGSIATLTNINPGADYNINPFVIAHNPFIAGYGRHDYIATVNVTSGGFIAGEQIQQTYSNPAVQLTVNTFSGTAANGTATTTVVLGEYVYQSNATTNVVAYGYVLEAGLSLGAGTIKLSNVSGTFVQTTSVATKMKSLSSGGVANVSLVTPTTTAIVARANIKQVANSSLLYLKRINLENTFTAGSALIGRTSGAVANLISIVEDTGTIAVGLNANVFANVQTANNVATSLAVHDSGFGYIDAETITLTKEDSNYQITSIVGLGKQGVGSGFYTSTKGFLDSTQKIQDNDYYQNYSYEIQTKLPYIKYIDVLKKITHVAGTKPFGKVKLVSVVSMEMTAINTIEIL